MWSREFCGMVNSGGGEECTCGIIEGQRQDIPNILCERTSLVNDKWIWLDLTHLGTHLSSFKETFSTKGISSLSVFPMTSRCLSKFMMHWKQKIIWVTVNDPTMEYSCKKTSTSEKKHHRESRVNPTFRDRRVWRPRDKFFSLSSNKKKIKIHPFPCRFRNQPYHH